MLPMPTGAANPAALNPAAPAPMPGGPPGAPPPDGMMPPGGAPMGGGMPGPPVGDPKTRMQSMILERLQQMPPEQKELLVAALTPQVIDAIKTIMPEIGFVFDAIAVGSTDPTPKGEMPDGPDMSAPPPDATQQPYGATSLPRSATRLGGM